MRKRGSLGAYILRTSIFVAPGAAVIGLVVGALDHLSWSYLVFDAVIAAVFGILLGIIVASLNYQRFVRPIGPIIEFIHNVQNGNWEVTIHETKASWLRDISTGLMALAGHFKQLLDETNRAASSLSEQNRTLTDAAEQFRLTAESTATTAEEVARREQENQAALTHLLSDTTQLNHQIAGASRRTDEESHLILQALHRLTNANQAMTSTFANIAKVHRQLEDVSVGLKQFGNAATAIQSTSKIITAVAKQTTLLALNASIEAARAGESGRSFAVVAAQVGSLSDEAQQASLKIHEVTETTATSLSQLETSVAMARAQMDASVKVVQETEQVVRQATEHLETVQSGRQEIEQALKQSLEANSSMNQWFQTLDQALTETNEAMKALLASSSAQTQVASTVLTTALQMEEHAAALTGALRDTDTSLLDK